MKKVTTRNTKAELVAAYKELAKEFSALKAQKDAAPEMKALPPAPGEDSELSIADIINRLKGLTASIGESASALQGNLTVEATTLSTLREEGKALIVELKDLHGIEVSEDSLDKLIADYSETSEAADAELSEKKKAFEKERSAAKAAWKKEQEEHARAAKEGASQLKKTRQRNAQEYKYDTEHKHKQEQDEVAQGRKGFDAELTTLREGKEAEWTEREKTLKEREDEYAELKTKSDAFDGELESAVKKAEAEGTSIAKRQTKTQADLKKKDNESIRRVFELKIKALEETIGKQDAQIEQLSAQLEAARRQTTELAVKAIDGASNASSFAAIKEIALEQAKNTPKGK